MDRAKIEEALQKIPGKLSVYYKNLVTGETIGIGEEIPMMAASVIKIPIMVECFRQMKAGEHKKNELYVLKESDKRPSCGCLNRMHAGLNLTMEDLYNLMIILSDNSATNILIELLGGMDRINRELQKLGFNSCRVNRLLFDAQASAMGIQNYVSALEIGNMLEGMYRKTLIDEESSEEMIQILLEQRLNNKFPFYFKEKVQIAHKTGEDEGITHDVGIFFGKRPFVLCCLGNETDCPSFNRFMQQLARELYNENQIDGEKKA